MPELPEVETTLRFLLKKIKNKKIIQVDVFKEKLLKNSTPYEFKNFCLNKIITDIKRRGKYLIFILDDKYMFISHLRMSGSYRVIDKKTNLITHDHIVFNFKDFYLIYNDPRAFGTLNLYNHRDYEKIIKIGIEPLNKNFSETILINMLSKNKQKIKAFLLDQKNISGIGNIYADEILFCSKILPWRISNSLTKNETENLHKNIKKVLEIAIKNKGTTIKSFSFDSKHGNNQNFLKVYHKDYCVNCNSEIKKIKISSRTTHYCSKCQF